MDTNNSKDEKAQDIFKRIIEKPSDQSVKDEFREKLLKEMYIVEK